MEKTTGLHGKSFFESNAFSAGQGAGKISTVYASELTVEELREHYKSALSASEYGRNDETALHLSAELPQGGLDIVNYFSQVCRVLDMELTLNAETAAGIAEQLGAAFPEAELAAIAEIASLRAGEAYGRYVRYTYDDLNENLYKGKPIFSEARLFSGGETELSETLAALAESYPTNNYDASSQTRYYKTESGILGISLSENAAGEPLAAISFQLLV